MNQSQLKQLIKGIIREVIGMDVKPPHQNVDADTEKEIALKSPFTAISYLMQHNNINLATHEFDKLLKGTPFQRTYETWLMKMHGREVREVEEVGNSEKTTCPQCKGQGHHEMTLKNRSGNFLAKRSVLVETAISASKTTTSGLIRPNSTKVWP